MILSYSSPGNFFFDDGPMGLPFDRGWGLASAGSAGPSLDQMMKKFENERSVAKIKVQVMAINSVQVSSKSELSSTTFGRFKVYAILRRKPIAASDRGKLFRGLISFVRSFVYSFVLSFDRTNQPTANDK